MVTIESQKKIAFITPTKDRPSELRTMLESLAEQSRKPDQVIIVDSSLQSVQGIVDQFEDRLPVHYVRWQGKPSAAAQRNEGLRHLRCGIDLVCFFDDDQVLYSDAIERMLSFWASAGPDVAGSAFNQANWEDDRPSRLKRSRLSEYLGLYSRQRGAVAPSGWQSIYGRVQQNTEVAWQGSGMSVFRRSILEQFRFDEYFDGYSYLEDLDFSYSISRKHKLVVVADALFDHFHSPSGRVSNYRFGKVEVRNRVYLVRKHHLSIWRCYLAIAVRMVMSIISAVMSFECAGLARAFGNVVGLVKSFSSSKRKQIV